MLTFEVQSLNLIKNLYFIYFYHHVFLFFFNDHIIIHTIKLGNVSKFLYLSIEKLNLFSKIPVVIYLDKK